MNQQEFNSKLERMVRSHLTWPSVPALLKQARDAHLSIPVVLENSNSPSGKYYSAISVQGRLLVLCSAFVPSALHAEHSLDEYQHVKLKELDGFFEKLIRAGYDGIAFVNWGNLLGIEWADLFDEKEMSEILMQGSRKNSPKKKKKMK